MSSTRSTEIAAGALVVALAAGFLGYALVLGGRATLAAGDRMALSARFDRIDGLADGADVRLAGVKVGTVSGARVDPVTFGAEVILRVDRALSLPADSSAEITSDGLLGGKYVSLVPGGSERVIPPGGRIQETQGSVSLEQLLGRFIFSVTQMNTRREDAAEPPPR